MMGRGELRVDGRVICSDALARLSHRISSSLRLSAISLTLPKLRSAAATSSPAVESARRSGVCTPRRLGAPDHAPPVALRPCAILPLAAGIAPALVRSAWPWGLLVDMLAPAVAFGGGGAKGAGR